MARGRKKKSKDQAAGKQIHGDKKTDPAPKMASSKRTAEVMTDPIDEEISDLDDPRPARRQRTTDSPAADGDARPRFQTRLLSPKRAGPSNVAAAVAAHHPLNVPHVTLLSQKYRVESVTITRNSDMEPKIRRIREMLKTQQTNGSTRPLIVTVSAREDAVGKAISIVEIVKGTFRDEGEVCYQYTAPWSRLELLPGPMEAKFGPGRRLRDGAITSGDEREDEVMQEGEAQSSVVVAATDPVEQSSAEQGSQHFQVMEDLQRPKVRNIALTTCYLSREPVVELRQLFG